MIIVRWIEQVQGAAQARVGPFFLGCTQGFFAVASSVALLTAGVLATNLPNPSEQTFRDLAQLDGVLFVAFAVAIAAVGPRSGQRIDDHLNWLGFGSGVAICGLIAAGSALALAAYREAGHGGSLATIGFCWSAVAILMLGLLVALLPLVFVSSNADELT